LKSYFEDNLARFAHILRHLGIKTSTGEAIIALRALVLVDLLDREQVREALSATLIKNHDEQAIFNQAFDNFFTVPEDKERQRTELANRKIKQEEALDEASEALSFKGESLDMTEEERLLYAHLSETEKNKIKVFLKNSYVPQYRMSRFRPLLESQIRGTLRYWRQRLGEEESLTDINQQLVDDEALASILDDLDGEEKDILYEDMKKIASRDLIKVTNMLKKLSHKLATKISRRYRMSKKVDKIDLRSSIKANVRYGGIIFKLKYRQKRIQKPQILLICDVSGSMARYAAFVIQFIYGLSAVVKNIESFIFSEDLERVTPFFKKLGPFEDTMSELMNKSHIWGKGTNLGRSLSHLRTQYGSVLTPQTVVLIVSDTKTLELEEATQEFVRLKRSVKDVLWLNTLPYSEWKDLPSAQSFRQQCPMFECYTLSHLEQIIRHQFLS
jgi:uncharacterized protein with von Willebrand factor type A (vWA) domain